MLVNESEQINEQRVFKMLHAWEEIVKVDYQAVRQIKEIACIETGFCHQ